jgi:hypothetical protein
MVVFLLFAKEAAYQTQVAYQRHTESSKFSSSDYISQIDFLDQSQAPDEVERPNFDCNQYMCLSFAVFTILIAVKRVVNKREADFKVLYHIQQISTSEFDQQKEHYTT